VFEVKSRLTRRNIKDALSKLSELNEHQAQLPRQYCCGTIFVDLKETENQDQGIIAELFDGSKVAGFMGGLTWSRTEFSRFCINLLTRLEGLPHNEPDKISFGHVFDTVTPRATPNDVRIVSAASRSMARFIAIRWR
jgi:hypothetical protein